MKDVSKELKKHMMNMAGVVKENDEPEQEHSKPRQGVYWYRAFPKDDMERSSMPWRNGEWIIVGVEDEDEYPYQLIGSDETFSDEEILPGEFVGPLDPPSE